MADMSTVEDLLFQLLGAMSGIQDTLTGISTKLDNINGMYGLDDVAEKIDSGVRTLTGSAGYDLTDIHGALKQISSEVFDITLKLD